MIELLIKQGIQYIILKMGSNGVLIGWKDNENIRYLQYEAPKIEKIISVTVFIIKITL